MTDLGPFKSGSDFHLLTQSATCAQILLMGGADNNGNGLNYSQRLTSIGAGLQSSWVQENMQGIARIEGTAVLLPDGTVFLCSGAANGERLTRLSRVPGDNEVGFPRKQALQRAPARQKLSLCSRRTVQGGLDCCVVPVKLKLGRRLVSPCTVVHATKLSLVGTVIWELRCRPILYPHPACRFGVQQNPRNEHSFVGLGSPGMSRAVGLLSGGKQLPQGPVPPAPDDLATGLLWAGYATGAWDTGNTYSNFQTAPQIYSPTAPLGSRWSGLLVDSGIPRGYHNGALLIASAEVGDVYSDVPMPVIPWLGKRWSWHMHPG